MGWIQIAAQLVGAVVNAAGDLSQSNEEMRAARYRIRQQLRYAAEAEERQRIESQQIIAQQRATMVGSNVDPTSGSPLEQLIRNVNNLELTIQRERAKNLREASNEALQARHTRKALFIRAMTGWVSGATQVGGQIAGSAGSTQQSQPYVSLLNPGGGYGSGPGLYGGAA